MKIIGLESANADFLYNKIKILVDETFDIVIDRYIKDVINTSIDGLYINEGLVIIPFNNEHANEVRCRVLQYVLSGLDLNELDVEIQGYKSQEASIKRWGIVISLRDITGYFISTMHGNFIILSDTYITFGDEKGCTFSPNERVIFEVTNDGKFIKY